MSYVKAGKKHVNEVLKFLKKMGFKDVNGGDQFIIGGKQADACAGHEKTLLIFECTRQKDINAKITSFRGKIPDMIRGFKTHPKYKAYARYMTILGVKFQKVSDTNVSFGMEGGGRRVRIWDNRFFSYYSTLHGTIGEYAKYSLLAEIGITPENAEAVTVPAFSARVGRKGKYLLFLFFIEAKHLLKIAYVARRETGQEAYYQRMVSKDRLRAIAKYVEKGRVFPNSVVVALDERAWEFTPTPDKTLTQLDIGFSKNLSLGRLNLLNSYRSCWIIDGQHRLYSYTKTTVPGFLAVSAFARVDKETQADYFLDINLEAKRVSPNLLWDLLGSLHPGSPRGVISNAVKKLRGIPNGFFESKIKIPSLGPGRFNFNNLCVTLDKKDLAKQLLPHLHKNTPNPLSHNNADIFETNLAQALNQYFLSLDDQIDSEKKEVYTDGFVSVMISLFRLLLTHIKKKPSVDSEKAFLAPIAQFINACSTDEIHSVKTSLSSEGGKTSFHDDLIRLLRDQYDPEFAIGMVRDEQSLAEKIRDLELELNQFVNSILVANFGEDWIQNQKFFPDPAQRKECDKRAKLNNRPPWEYINFQTTVTSIIMGRELWAQFFEDMFISSERFSSREQLQILTQELWNYRSNKLGHKRPKPVPYSKDKEAIIKGAYNIFKSIIADQ
jgi:DGQHR domain-containing protein